MFERFGDRSRRIVVGAQEEARLLRAGHIGSEHLLVALARDGDDDAVSGAFDAFALTHRVLRDTIEELFGAGESVPSGHIPFTPDAKRALEAALREALRLEDSSIEPDHLLLAICADVGSPACEVLDARQVRPAALAAKVHELRVVRSGRSGAVRGATRSATARGMLQTWSRASRASERLEPRCALCGRDEDSCERVLVAGGVRLCSDCAHAAVTLLDALPHDAPKLVRYRRPEFAPKDKDAAVDAIERAFDAVFSPVRLPVDEALAYIEGGEDARDLLESLREGVDSAPMVSSDQTVERVRFIAETEAEVSFGIWMPGSPQPMLFPVHSVCEAGTWKVARSAVQHFAQMAQQYRRQGF